MVENHFDERVKDFIRELDNHRIELEIIKDMLDLTQLEIIEILDRE